MSKVSPMIRSFNGGETSILMEGRTDIDRYPSSARTLLNCVAAPQGPAIPRSGTGFVNAAYDHSKKSSLMSFDASEEERFMIEFCDQRCRFFTNDGILVYGPVASTMISTAPFVVNAPGLDADVGMEVSLSDWPDQYNLNGEVVKITAKVGTQYTLNIAHPAFAPAAGIKLAKVYSIASPYTEAMLPYIRSLQSLDVVYIVNKKIKPYKLKHSDTYSWSFEAVNFIDGPYADANETATTFKPSATGNPIPVMTANNVPAGYTASSSSANGANEAYRAFDDSSLETIWQCNAQQEGYIQIQAPAPFVCDGYTIYGTKSSIEINYLPKDSSPSTWSFEGSNDGGTWTVLDKQNAYVLYNKNRSVFFKIKNTTAYSYYRLVIAAVVRNGAIAPAIRNLVLRSPATSTFTITASSIVGINNDQGFKATDVGRLMRVKGFDGNWRSLKITGYTSPTVVTVQLQDEPFLKAEPVTEWRLGYWSDTTGWPNALTYYQKRIWYGGSDAVPDLIVASMLDRYEDMSPTEPDEVVLDTNSIVNVLNSRKRARIRWIKGSDKGLLAGTASQEFVVSSDGSSKSLTPGTAEAKDSSSRGSAEVDPVPMDNAVLFLQSAARNLREFSWSYEADGYKAPSMSTLSSHLGAVPFEEMAYAAEPYSIVWLRRRDGKLIGMTYNRDENVVGWHRHDISDGFVESIAVMRAPDNLQDDLWMVVRRVIKGVPKRYIEKLSRFWDFGVTVNDAHYVDCALRYEGEEAITDVYGLQHLEGQSIYGLANGKPIGPIQVIGGKIELSTAANRVIVGIGFESIGETSRLENGARDGTAIGKPKRIHRIKANVWDSYGGEFGVWDEQREEVAWSPAEYPYPDASMIEPIVLHSGFTKPITPVAGYEANGSVFFRRTKEIPLPFNVVSLMPQMDTQDG